MYTNNQIQEMINTLQSDPDKRNRFNILLGSINTDDQRSINYILRSGYVEDFDRFDSAVCDSFIRLYERI